MQIQNPELLSDVLDILASGPTYRNRVTGETIQARPLSDIACGLRDRTLYGGRHNWRNVSDIDHDLDDSGFRYVYPSKGQWVQVYGNGSEGRTVASTTTLVTL